MNEPKEIKRDGPFYSYFLDHNGYSSETKTCIEETVHELVNRETDASRPGVLLGKVQSGKTRTFIGIMALCFDNNYDVVVVLTKGTKALAKQTLKRLREEFCYFVEVTNEVRLYDVMAINDNMTKYILGKKLVFVVKKEDDNMRRLEELFFNSYRELATRNILIVDDEADFASIGFSSTKEFGLRMNVIASQINQFRKMLSNRCDLLQVTATPYSLYLQPDEIIIKEEVFQPLRPSFTKLVPIHDKYVGGQEYFELSENEESIYFHLWEEVSDEELQILSRPHGSYLNNIMTTESLTKFRSSIITFIVGATIRRMQCKTSNEKEMMYSFIIHTDVAKAKHSWQMDLAERLKEVLEDSVLNDSKLLDEYLVDSYNDICSSMKKVDTVQIPTFQEVKHEVVKAIKEEHLGINTVNSDSDIETLLSDNGQLSLDNPLNIFIGGQILDRGITIENLIGFFYGRNPNKFQLDTVLQHSRMYGARPIEDMAVTRFYTSYRIYDAMKRMHEIDCALRDGFEKNQFDKGVIFIQQDTKKQIRPCSPNKILLSETISVRPSGRLLPVGFTTANALETRKSIDRIDNILLNYVNDIKDDKPFLIDAAVVSVILQEIALSLEFEDGYEFDWDSYITTINYLSNSSQDPSLKGRVHIMLRHDRQARRQDQFQRFNGKPESTTSGREGFVARQKAEYVPFILLLRQSGQKELGWKGNPFWWPVAYMPQKMKPLVFSTEKF